MQSKDTLTLPEFYLKTPYSEYTADSPAVKISVMSGRYTTLIYLILMTYYLSPNILCHFRFSAAYHKCLQTTVSAC